MTFSEFDSSQETVDWARAKVQQIIDKYRRFERESTDPERSREWKKRANMLEMEFVGGEGCVIAAFDKRLPKVAKAMIEQVPS